MRKIICLILAVVLTASLAGCVEEELLIGTISVTLEPGGTAQIAYTVKPATADLAFTSEDNTVATVNNLGFITAMSVGETKITVAGMENSPSVSVLVTPKTEVLSEAFELEEPLSLTVHTAEYELEIGDYALLRAEVNKSAVPITYESNNPEIADVDKDGILSAVAPGTAFVTVRAEDRAETVTVTVLEPEQEPKPKPEKEPEPMPEPDPEPTPEPGPEPQTNPIPVAQNPPTSPVSPPPSASKPEEPAVPPSIPGDPDIFFANAVVTVEDWVDSAVYFTKTSDEHIYYNIKGREIGRSSGRYDYVNGHYPRTNQGLLNAFNDYRGADQVTIQLALAPELNESGLVSDYATEVINLINEERTARGLYPLSADPGLTGAAEIRAQELLQLFSHTRPNGSTGAALAINYGSGLWAAENIAAGQPSSYDVVDAWMNSQGHRNNILDGNGKITGVACYADGYGKYYWVQLFAG